jgi:hypothetical protein
MNYNWYALFEDNIYRQYETPNNDVRCSYWIKEINTGKKFKTSNGNIWGNYRYEFYTPSLELTAIDFNGWKILSAYDVDHVTVFSNLIIKVSDPKGEIINAGDSCGSGITGLIKAIKNLRESSSFDSWQYYNLFKENQELKNEILLKNRELERLTQKIIGLKNSTLFVQVMERLNQIDLKNFKTREVEFEKISKDYNTDKKIIKLLVGLHV